MRSRLIPAEPHLDPAASPFERFQQFARQITAVSKTELEKEIKRSGSAKHGAGRKRKVHDGSSN
jgi:hypothetical protein